MRSGALLAAVLLSGGCATAASGPVLTERDVLRVLADRDADRMPAALVTGRRLGMAETIAREFPGFAGNSDRSLRSLQSRDPADAAQGMLDYFGAYGNAWLELDPNLERTCCIIVLSSDFLELRRIALEGREPARSRALAVLVAVRDSVDFETVQRIVAAARRCTTEPLAAAFRAELTDENLLSYVRAEASQEKGSRDGKWALQVFAAEKRRELVEEVLGYLPGAANGDFPLALGDFFERVGGAAGVAGLRYLIENAGPDDEPGKVHGLAPMYAICSLSNEMAREPGAEEAACAGLFANRGDLAIFALSFLEERGRAAASLEALDRAMAMASRGELNLDPGVLEHLTSARQAVAARSKE